MRKFPPSLSTTSRLYINPRTLFREAAAPTASSKQLHLRIHPFALVQETTRRDTQYREMIIWKTNFTGGARACYYCCHPLARIALHPLTPPRAVNSLARLKATEAVFVSLRKINYFHRKVFQIFFDTKIFFYSTLRNLSPG